MTEPEWECADEDERAVKWNGEQTAHLYERLNKMHDNLIEGRLTKSTAGSVCYDVHSTGDYLLTPNSITVVPTGIRTTMVGCCCLLLDRSGLAAKYGVSRRAGVIDPDYDQEWMAVLVNESREPYQIRAGDRICQAMFVPIFDVPVTGSGVDVKDDTRKGGLGSTGG